MALSCPMCHFKDDNERILTRHIEDAHFSDATTEPAPASEVEEPPSTVSQQSGRRKAQKKEKLLLDHDIYGAKPAYQQEPPVSSHNRHGDRPPRAESSTPSASRVRGNIKPGARVQVVLKADQPTGKLTEGVVAQLLTNSVNHPRGIKVKLRDGQVGRVQNILGSEPA